MAFELPDLPYAKSALEPHISAKTLECHHDHHHRAYVDKLNKLIAGTSFEKMGLEEIILATAKSDQKPQTDIFNNAAQAWNHTFLWNSMSPKGGKPSGALAQAIDKDLGGFDTFAENFKKAAVGQFGSGWAWLTLANGKLEITATANADTPLVHGKTPLLTLDVWEHAYYLDYQNRRPDYVSTFLEKIANWEFAASNLQKASQRKAAE